MKFSRKYNPWFQCETPRTPSGDFKLTVYYENYTINFVSRVAQSV
jgi:hypothetical protein